MPATTETSTTTVAPLRLSPGERVVAWRTLASHPDDRDRVEQDCQRDEDSDQRTVARTYRPLSLLPWIHRRQCQFPPVWSTSSRLKIRNRYNSEKANIRRAMRSPSSRQTWIAEPVNAALSSSAPAA